MVLLAKHSNTIPKVNFLREGWGWEGEGIFLPLQNSFTSDGWKSFLQPFCSRELGAQPGKPFQMLPDAPCITKAKNPPSLLPDSWATQSPGEVKNWLWAGECSSPTLLGSVRTFYPSCESQCNCGWWGGEGQYRSKSLMALVKLCRRKAESQARHLTSGSGHEFDWNSDLGLDSFARDPNQAF